MLQVSTWLEEKDIALTYNNLLENDILFIKCIGKSNNKPYFNLNYIKDSFPMSEEKKLIIT